MRFQVDEQFLLDTFCKVVNTPSPVGYTAEMKPVLEAYAQMFGEQITYDRRGTAYITLEGQDNSKTVMIGAHVDTIGFVVRRVDPNGVLRVRALGGINYSNAEGETVTVHTRDGRKYTGLITCQAHSTHVFEDARSMPRDENTMMILLDQKVSTKAEVNGLGIRNGDYVSIEAHCEVTENGYIKSRFIDDKAAVACSLTALKYLKDHGLQPKFRTVFAFPYHEEIGAGGGYLPGDVAEYVAIDIGLIGPDYDGSEHGVSICAKDARMNYHYDLTNRLIGYAEKAGCDYAVEAFFRYSTDAAAAVLAGNNVAAAAFGMAVYCSHGRERTHVEGLRNTMNLLLAYVLDI